MYHMRASIFLAVCGAIGLEIVLIGSLRVFLVSQALKEFKTLYTQVQLKHYEELHLCKICVIFVFYTKKISGICNDSTSDIKSLVGTRKVLSQTLPMPFFNDVYNGLECYFKEKQTLQ